MGIELSARGLGLVQSPVRRSQFLCGAVVHRILFKALSNELDVGEAEAIALALEIRADRVLIDERRGRLIASRLNLRYTGILGI